ncbi:MAG TPA: hypothetical protein VKX28_00610 [Xanthobacteraceae bacterium]|nr:hypothetical protein [Xanthobacteraceae bacterium]
MLQAARLVRSEKIGRVRMCSIEPDARALAEQWVNARRVEWEHRLARLNAYLDNLPKEETGDAD